jgi:hypothetical protein
MARFSQIVASGLLENLNHLDRHFVQNLDMGAGNFLQKLEAQLAPAPAS